MSSHPANLRAVALIKRATDTRKPLRIFLGFRSQGANKHSLSAVDDATKLCKSLPRAEMTIAGDSSVDEVAKAIDAHWETLTATKAAMRADAVPTTGHDWRVGQRARQGATR